MIINYYQLWKKLQLHYKNIKRFLRDMQTNIIISKNSLRIN